MTRWTKVEKMGLVGEVGRLWTDIFTVLGYHVGGRRDDRRFDGQNVHTWTATCAQIRIGSSGHMSLSSCTVVVVQILSKSSGLMSLSSCSVVGALISRRSSGYRSLSSCCAIGAQIPHHSSG